jgi:hypothetical protein
MPPNRVAHTLLFDKPPEKPTSGSSTGVDVASWHGDLPAAQNKAGLVGLHFREAQPK